VRVGGGALERGELLGAVRAQPRAVRVLAEVHDVRGPLGGGESAEEGEQDDGDGERRHGLWMGGASARARAGGLYTHGPGARRGGGFGDLVCAWTLSPCPQRSSWMARRPGKRFARSFDLVKLVTGRMCSISPSI
jgi:hypothetical protein